MRYSICWLLLLSAVLSALAFQPTDLPGLKLWVRADAGVTKDAEGRVSRWADGTGNGNDFAQATPGLQPVLVENAANGKPAIRFDGVDDGLALATAIPVSGKSVFAVVKWNRVKGYSFALGCDAGTDGYLRMSNATELLTGGRYPMLYQNSIPSPKFGYAPGDGRQVFHKNLRSLLQWNVYAITDNPPGNEKLKHLGMNELNNVPANRFDGEIAEVLVYDTALSAADRLKIEEYLEQKYLGWPAMKLIPVAMFFPLPVVGENAIHPRPTAVKSPEVPLNSLDGLLAHGISDKTLAPGRYSLSFHVQQPSQGVNLVALIGETAYRATPSLMAGHFTVHFIQSATGPVLIRVAGEKTAGNATPENMKATTLFLAQLSPLCVQELSSDKILYSPNQQATATATIHNYAAEPIKADIRFTEITGLDDRRVLGTKPVEVPAGGEATVTLPYTVGASEYGRDLLVEILRDGKVVEAKGDSYSVADNLWKVAIGAPTQGALANSADYSDEVIIKQLRELRKGYCNWIEKDFWAPDDWGLMVTPPGATWFSGQARRHENTEKLQLQIKAAHDLGMKAITYGKCMAGGLPGWELARTKPQWFSVDAYGRTMGRPADVWDLEHWQEADKYKYTDYKYAWTYRWVDLRRLEPLDHGIDQLIASAKQFGWDGVRYDSGGFRAHFVDGKFDGVDSYNARNMRYTKERVWKALPGFLFGVNTNDPVAQANSQGVCPLLPTDTCGHEFREMMAGGGLWMFEGMRDKPNFWGRTTYKTWSAYAKDMVQAVRTIKGYGGHACCSYGDTELYKFIIGTMVGCHDYVGEHLRAGGSENWGRFLTRWSSFLWDHRLRALPEAEKLVTVKSATPLWWKEYANELVVSPTKRYVIIHLLNPPVNDEMAKTKNELPKPVTDCHLSLLAGKEQLVRVMFITPGTPNRAIPLIVLNSETGVAEISVPRLDIWGMVVVELNGTYSVPKDAPAFTEPLSPAELAEMERCKPTDNVPVADNLLNPTPKFDPEKAKVKDFGTPKVTAPADLQIGGEAGMDVLLVKGFYHYTYRLPEALKLLAPQARITECTTRDLPKDYPDLYKYDVVVLIDMGADAWNADGQKRLADYVQAGGRLVVLGGPFTLGQGFFTGTALESILPVQVRQARDVYQLPKPLPLGMKKGVPAPGKPLLYYYHAVHPKPGAKTLLWAGDLPVLYEWTSGKGTASVFTGTTMGEAGKGETPFWQWDGWAAMAVKMVVGEK
ncbi:MAG: alpha-amylase family protein [Armatimonadota bacterium]